MENKFASLHGQLRRTPFLLLPSGKILDVIMIKKINISGGRLPKSPAKLVGLLIGTAAATPGLSSPVPSMPLKPWHICLLLALAIGFNFRRKLERNFIPKLYRVDVALILFSVATLMVDLINAKDLNFTADYMVATRPIFWLMVLWAGRFVLHSMEDASDFLVGFTLPVFPSAVIGFGQLVGIDFIQQFVIKWAPDSAGLSSRLDQDKLIRATGFVQNWTQFGAYLCTVIAAAMALLITSKIHKIGNALYPWLVLMTAGFAVLSTLTLSAVGTALAIFLVCSREAKAIGKSLSILIFVGLISSAFLSAYIEERLDQQFATSAVVSSDGDGSWIPSTLLYREKIWITETIPMVAERPLTGWGSNVYAAAQGATGDVGRVYPNKMKWLSPESQWFSLLMNFGSIGLIGFLCIVFYMVKILYKSYKVKASWIYKPTATLLFMMIISAFVASVFTNHGLPIGLWALLAVVSIYQSKPQYG